MGALAQAQAMFPDRLVTNVWKGLAGNLHVWFADGGEIDINTNPELGNSEGSDRG